jgi:hypothetical protein
MIFFSYKFLSIMKNLFISSFSLLLMTWLTVSCHNENLSPECDVIETFYNDEFENITCSLQNINTDDQTVNLVIKTQADYEKYFICGTQLPAVDFDKYFIITGGYRHNNCAIFDSQQVQLCNNKIIYGVRMLEQDCHAITNVYYATVIEKKYENLAVEFDVKFAN